MFDNIAQGAKSLNIKLPPGARAAFEAYYDLLSKHGKSVNLTAISGAKNVAELHFLDSLSLLTVSSFSKVRLIDIGSGAGFPGVPLKLAEPTIDLTLLDATGKRITFLKELCALLDINATCIHARAEDTAHDTEMREQFDTCVSRAVAKLNVLCELCLPFVKLGGLFIAMKSIGSDVEFDSAQNAVSILGGEVQELVDYAIPGTDIIHRAILIRKVSKTPDNYPRRFARIQKSPL